VVGWFTFGASHDDISLRLTERDEMVRRGIKRR
jgi:hypothetical protein